VVLGGRLLVHGVVLSRRSTEPSFPCWACGWGLVPSRSRPDLAPCGCSRVSGSRQQTEGQPARRRGQGVVGRVAAPVFFILSVCRGASMECDVDPSRVELGSKMFLSHLMGGYPWGEPSRCSFVSFNLDVLYIPAGLH
jgi:hypothetical protein